MISLLFNHGLVEGVAYRPPDVTGRAAGEVIRVVEHARRLWPESRFYVHENLASVDVGQQVGFKLWASKNANRPELRDCIRQLLQVCDQGPFLGSLPLDGRGLPDEIRPYPDDASATVVEVVERGLHHRLAHPASRAWIISFGHGAVVLPCPEYEGRRGDERAALLNLLNRNEGESKLAAAVASELASRRELLDRVMVAAPRVHFLKEVEKGIDNATIEISLERLFRALVGLETYARVIEQEGGDPKKAYEEETGVEMSDVSSTVHQHPNLRKQLEHLIPGEPRKTLFGYHLKPGSTRIHFAWRCSMEEAEGGPVRQAVVWVGYIGKHTKGAKDL